MGYKERLIYVVRVYVMIRTQVDSPLTTFFNAA